jgi:hypothetical protein
MFLQRRPTVAALMGAALALLSSVASGDDSSPATTVALVPRDALLPVSVVSEYFPDVTQEASTGPNETSVGKPTASRSVVYVSADGKKKVTLSVDQYASVHEAASAYQTAVEGSKAAPGFEPAAAPDLGEEAFAGTSQVGAERHFGLGARDGTLILSAPHAGDIAVTPDNSNKLARLGGLELTTAKQVLGSAGGHEHATPAQATGNGRVTIVYEEDNIQPENRDVVKTIRDSGVFERMAERLSNAVALPHDIEVVVTDDLPKGVDVATTELDGRRILWPAAFFKLTHDALTKFLPEVVRDKGPPKVIAEENFTPDTLNVWGNQFILGHELGHAVIHQLNLPLTGLEEDSADGFATFFTVNDHETGPNAVLGAAVLFDAMGSGKTILGMEDFSSDHAVILQRVYNFLCAAVGNNPQRFGSLVTDGYIPELRAILCGKEWAQLNYGWWTMLEPHLTPIYKAETESVRQQARQNLEEENSALFKKIKEMRGQQ